MTRWWPVHGDDEIEAVTNVLRSGCTNMWIGSEVFAFERDYAAMVGVPHAVAVSNGTVALEAALRALRLPPGSEVIVPCRTFVACAAAVATVGLTPVIADIGPELNITRDAVMQRLTARTSAVMVVHYAGLPVGDLAGIVAECRARRISVIEDCAHAHGAAVGHMGDIATWSMCQGKIISTGGEGGMVTTPNGVLAEHVRGFRDHGRFQMAGKIDSKEFEWTVRELGSNLRMTEMQAAIGRVQLRKLPGWTVRRREIMRRYVDVVGSRTIGYDRWEHSAGYMFLFHAGDIFLRQRMFDEVTSSRWGGCSNIVREPALIGAHYRHCPVADHLGKDIVSLPVYPTMTDEEVGEVCDQVRAVLA